MTTEDHEHAARFLNSQLYSKFTPTIFFKSKKEFSKVGFVVILYCEFKKPRTQMTAENLEHAARFFAFFLKRQYVVNLYD